MRILICGGRHFANQRLFNSTMKRYEKRAKTIVHGSASGADTMAGEWAREHNIEEIACPANWKRYGLSAGPIRNQDMLERYQPDLVIAFPGGRGTMDMVARALSANVPVIQIKH